MRYDARELAALADGRLGVPVGPQARARRRSASTRAPVRRPPSSSSRSRSSRSSTTTCRSCSIRCWASSPSSGIEVRLVVHPVFAVERDGRAAPDRPSAARRPATGAGTRESFIHIHVERIDDEARRAEIVTRLASRCSRDVRVAVADWRAMRGACRRGRSPSSRPIRRRCRSTRSPRRSSSSNGSLADNFTFLGVRDYDFADRRATSSSRMCETGLGILRARRGAGAAPRQRARRRSRRRSARSSTSRSRSSSPRPTCARACIAASHMDYVGVKRFDADGKLIGEFRIVGLFTSTAYTRSTRAIPYLRRKVDAVLEPRRLRSRRAIPARRSSTCWRPIRATSCSRSTRTRSIAVRAGDPAARRAPARARAGAPRPLRPLRLGARLRAARPLRQRGRARRSATIWPRPINGRIARLLSVLPRRAAGARPLHHRPRRGRDARVPTAPTLEAGSRRDRAHLDRRARRRARAGPRCRRRRARCSSATARPSRPAIARPIRRRPRSPTSASSRACRRERPLGVDFYRARRRRTKRAIGLKVWSYGRPIPLSERVPVLENMGFRVVDERTYHDRAGGHDAPDVWLHDMVLERADGGAIDLAALKQRLEACFLVVMRGRRRERRLQRARARRPACRGATSRCVRTISRYLRQIRVPYSQDYMWATLRQARRPRGARSSRCSTRASIPRARAVPTQRSKREAEIARARSRRRCRRSTASTRTASCAASSIWCRRRCAPTSTSSAPTAGRRPRSPSSSTAASVDGAAAAAPALRDLRLFAARRGRASALRQGRARRHPLVRPAAGFPHRGARPGQGAAGQERRHRAGRRQGRLRAEAAAASAARARRSRPRASPPTSIFMSTLLDITDNIGPARRDRRPTTWCATTATIPIWWSPPTRAPRPSPTSPTASRRSTASGSATPSPPAARPATTTRRWASPRAAPGRR